MRLCWCANFFLSNRVKFVKGNNNSSIIRFHLFLFFILCVENGAFFSFREVGNLLDEMCIFFGIEKISTSFWKLRKMKAHGTLFS